MITALKRHDIMSLFSREHDNEEVERKSGIEYAAKLE